MIATQSTHKQLAGFSQASQIHVRDAHIRDKPFRVNHKRFNEMFMLQASTSPFYPLFSSLDVNAQMHGDEAGRVLWDDAIKLGIEARKAVRQAARRVPRSVRARRRRAQRQDREVGGRADRRAGERAGILAARARRAAWHGYRHLGQDAAMVDPTKLMLTTPGIDHETGEYQETGIPATILADFLRENNVIPEKNDLNSILFLMTPAIGEGKIAMLLAALERFKALHEADAPARRGRAAAVRRAIRSATPATPCDSSARRCTTSIASRNVKELQRLSFRYESFPEQAMTAREAIRGDWSAATSTTCRWPRSRPHRRDAGAHLSAGHRDHRPGRTLRRGGASR